MSFIEYDIDFVTMLSFDKRPFCAEFRPNVVFATLDRFKTSLNGLQNYLKKFKTRVIWIDDADVVSCGGEFDSQHRNGRINLHIQLNSLQQVMIFDDEDWSMLKFRIVQTIMHELIHWRQYDLRNDDDCAIIEYVSTHVDAAYYATLDEIEAYAHCAFLEMQREYSTEPVSNILTKYGGETYNFILRQVFDNDFTNKAARRYVREILRWENRYKNCTLIHK